MENILSEDESMLELQIDEDSAESLESASWWARFSSVVIALLLFMILIVVVFLMNSNLFYSLGASFEFQRDAGALIWIALLAAFGFCGLMIALLINFASKTVTAIRQVDQHMLERGLSSLKIYFILYGILSILGFIGTMLTLLN